VQNLDVKKRTFRRKPRLRRTSSGCLMTNKGAGRVEPKRKIYGGLKTPRRKA